MPANRVSAQHQRAELDALSGDERFAAAAKAVQQSHDLDVVRHTIAILADALPAYRDDLVEKYAWCEAQPYRRDGGGYIRAAIVRALQPVSQPADIPMFLQAMQSYEMDGPFEVCGELRSAGLLAMNEVDPDIAATMAVRLMLDPQVTFSGEPARLAIALLASHGNLAPVFGQVSWGTARNDVIADGLRSLIELPAELLPLLVERYLESDDEQIVLGLFELLLGHRTRDTWTDVIEGWFRTTTIMDLYGIVAIQVVASRSEVLITMLRDLRHTESERLRAQLLDQALELA